MENKEIKNAGSSQFVTTFGNYQEFIFHHRGYDFYFQYTKGMYYFYLLSDYDFFDRFFDNVRAKRLDRMIVLNDDGTTNFPRRKGIKMPLQSDGTWDLKAFSESQAIRDYLDHEMQKSLKHLMWYLPKAESRLAYLTKNMERFTSALR